MAVAASVEQGITPTDDDYRAGVDAALDSRAHRIIHPTHRLGGGKGRNGDGCGERHGEQSRQDRRDLRERDHDSRSHGRL